MKKTLFVLMILLLIPFGTAACSSDNTKAEQPAEAESMADYTSGTPWMCIDLEGVVTPDTPADVKDNFALLPIKKTSFHVSLRRMNLSPGLCMM